LNAVDASGMNGAAALMHAVSKTLFLDIVKVLTANGFSATFGVPSMGRQR
jgi:hypothetical protein